MELNKIFERMARQGKTGKDLANYLKVTQQTVTNWKIGVSESYKKRLPEIAVFLNTTVEELTGMTSPAEETISLSRHEISLIQAYRANEKMQEAVDTLLGIRQEKDASLSQQKKQYLCAYFGTYRSQSENRCIRLWPYFCRWICAI